MAIAAKLRTRSRNTLHSIATRPTADLEKPKQAVRHHGDGKKQNSRVVDFKREKFGILGTVTAIEYDVSRGVDLALINYVDGEKRYITEPIGLRIGMTIMSGPDADPLVGNALPLKNIPVGTIVHNIELRPGKGAQMSRSAGAHVKLISKEGDYALLELPSGETRKVRLECMATIGQVGKATGNRQRDILSGSTGAMNNSAISSNIKVSPVRLTETPPASLQLDLSQVEAGIPLSRMKTFSESSGIPMSDLYDIVIPARTLKHRRARNESLSRDESDKFARLTRVYDYALRVFGDAEKARTWLSRPRKRFHDRSPLQILQTEIGGRLVEEYLVQIDYGMFA